MAAPRGLLGVPLPQASEVRGPNGCTGDSLMNRFRTKLGLLTRYRSRRPLRWPILRSARKPPTLARRLLVTVNGAMALLLAVFLVADYRRELGDHLVQKQIALGEEAKTLLPAILRLRAEGLESMQEYLDAVCARMQDTESPAHHIAVRSGTDVMQSTAHGRSSPAIYDAMRAASGLPHPVPLGDQSLVAGSASSKDVIVYVSEDVSAVRRNVLGKMLWRLLGILAMGAVAASLASLILLRTVAQPVKRFVSAVKAISRGEFDTVIDSANSHELASLGFAINGMSESLKRSAQQRQCEMAQAREIQEHLLPRSADVPGMKLAASYRPAAAVAGDYYDTIPLPDGSWLLCIADVSGHGVPAAMSAAMLKSLLTHASEHHAAPNEILEFVNRRFLEISPPGLFASMLLVRWQPRRGVLQYASAGHEPGLLRRADGKLTKLKATGFLLGIDPDAKWDLEEYSPRPGERFLAITDGVVEALNSDEELFGRQRVEAILASAADDGLEELVVRLNAALADHQAARPAEDDTTVLAVEFVGNAIPAQPGQLLAGHLPLRHGLEQGLVL